MVRDEAVAHSLRSEYCLKVTGEVGKRPEGNANPNIPTLTDRPGGNCGSGTGNTAKAAFEIRDGKIVKWLRVMDGETPQTPRGDPV